MSGLVGWTTAAALLASLASLGACGTTQAVELSPRSFHQATEQVPPALRKRLKASPYALFRFTNREFAAVVCAELRRFPKPVPIVDLHGDPHFEQLSVVGGEFGFVDFDDATRGPVVIDLVRLAASARIANIEYLASGRVDGSAARVIAGYRERLEGRNAPPRPRLVTALVGSQSESPRFADSVFAQSAGSRSELTDELGQGWARYVDTIVAHTSMPRWQFGVVEWHELRGVGLGSARSKRILIRISGVTGSPDDDIVLEAKELADLSGATCVQSEPERVVRVIDGFDNFAPYDDVYAAQVHRAEGEPADTPFWWIHSWRADYSEVDLDAVIERKDLTELATSTGWLLADGHLKGVPEPRRAELTKELLRFVVDRGPAIEQLAVELAALTLSAHAQLSDPP